MRDPGGTAGAFRIRSSILTRGVSLPRPRRSPRAPCDAGVVAFSMPLGLMSGRPFRPFSRAISMRCFETIRLRSATSPSTRTTRAFRSAADSASRLRGLAIHRMNQKPPCRGNKKYSRATGFAPVTSTLSQTAEFRVSELPLRGLQGQKAPERVAILGCRLGPVGLDRVPEFPQPFFVGVAVLNDEGGDPVGIGREHPVA